MFKALRSSLAVVLSTLLLSVMVFAGNDPRVRHPAIAGYFLFQQDIPAKTVVLKGQGSTPANPSAGWYKLFVDNTGALKLLNSAGGVTAFGTGGGFALQTETSFTDNSNAAIWLKGPAASTTSFLNFFDSSDNQLVGIESSGNVYAQRITSATGEFFSSTNSTYIKQADGSYGIELPRTGGIKFGPNYNGSAATDPSAWLDFTDTVEFSALTTGEKKLFWRNPALTYTWDTGAITSQRFFHLTAPTMAFDGASTVTNAATLAISGAPSAGTNATITNPYALWVESGVSRFDGNVSLGSSNVLLLAGATSPGTATRFQLGTPTTANNNVNLHLEPTATTATAIAIQGNSSQTADLFQTFNSAGTKTFFINSKGTAGGAPGSVATSTVFGYEALNGTTAGNEITAFGYRAGYSATNGIDYNVFFGASAGASLTSGAYNVLIGAGVLNGETSISNSVIIGQAAMSQSSATYTGAGPVFAVGRNAGTDLTTQQNIAVFGSYLAPFNDWYFGESYSTATPSDITFQPSVGSGTNIAGSSFYLKGGAGTGNAAPGKLYLQYASAGSSGATLQSYTTAVTIDSAATDVAGLFQADKIKGGSSTPSVAAQAGAGSGASATLTTGSTDTAGEIVITSGTTAAAGSFVTLTFSSAYSAAPFVTLTPSNTATAAIGADFDAWHYVTATTTTFTISLNGAVANTTEYRFMYHVIQ